MKIRNQEFKYLIIVNLISISIIYLDLFIPFNNIIKEEINSFYNTSHTTPGDLRHVGTRNNSVEIKCLLDCKSGNIYYLGKFPPNLENITKTKNVDIIQTPILNKTKALIIDNQYFSVSFLTLKLILSIFIFCLTVNILNIFFCNKFLDTILALGTAPIYFICIVYIVYF